MWSNTRYVWCCFYFSVIQLCCRQTCCLKYSDRLSAMLKYDSTTQSLSFNSGSPCSSWVWCEWQLSGGGIHMKPFYQCCPLGSAWLTAAQCKSSAIMESYCCIYTGETSFFYVRPLAKEICYVSRQILSLSSSIFDKGDIFYMSLNRTWDIWYVILSNAAHLNRLKGNYCDIFLYWSCESPTFWTNIILNIIIVITKWDFI